MDYPSTYTLAHTARCKLKLAADRPDRDLRFILGHAFTLDKLRLRLAEIEVSSSDSDSDPDDTYYGDDSNQPTCGGSTHNAADAPVAAEPHQVQRRISFTNNARPSVVPQRQRSPPPPGGMGGGGDSDSDGSDDGEGSESSDEEDYATLDEGLGLQRFGSAAARPPRKMPGLEADEEDGEDDVVEPRSLTEEELRMITGGEGSAELMDAYQHVAGCPCHGVGGVEKVGKMWEVPSKGGVRIAVVQVEA